VDKIIVKHFEVILIFLFTRTISLFRTSKDQGFLVIIKLNNDFIFLILSLTSDVPTTKIIKHKKEIQVFTYLKITAKL
jgi:hypothetical protein